MPEYDDDGNLLEDFRWVPTPYLLPWLFGSDDDIESGDDDEEEISFDDFAALCELGERAMRVERELRRDEHDSEDFVPDR